MTPVIFQVVQQFCVLKKMLIVAYKYVTQSKIYQTDPDTFSQMWVLYALFVSQID